MRIKTLIVLFALSISLHSQFVVNTPIVNTGKYAITDSVYMDPNGDDNNPGTNTLPVKTFNAAILKLPFGVAGVNGGNAYGLIKMKPGYYATNSGFQQTISNWKNGNTFRNVSIEGLGDVVIGGTQNTFANSNLLVLIGDHIFIKNITLKYSTGVGIYCNRNNLTYPRQNNILVDHVSVDSVGSFCALFTSVDTLLINNSAFRYSSRPGNGSLTSPCQWPSGFKLFNCTDGSVFNCEVGYSRGEGLNFQNSIRCQASQNRLHDNGLNLYNDNSSKLYIYKNILYNTPGIGTQYWRNCPADTDKIWASSGILIANEGSCVFGSLPSFNNCQTKCILPNETFSNVDSMFIYNNIFQNVGQAIGFWEGATGSIGINCIRNVWIYNNTIIGVMGLPGAIGGALVRVYYPSYNILTNSNYGYLQNIRISNNIFTYDTAAFLAMTPIIMNFHPQHPGPKDIQFSNNIWVKSHSYLSTTDLIRNNLPVSTNLLIDTLQLQTIQPSQAHLALAYNALAPLSSLNSDYLNRPRQSPMTNVGALEFYAIAGIKLAHQPIPSIYPNPCKRQSMLQITSLPIEQKYDYRLVSPNGTEIQRGPIEQNSISINDIAAGLYFLVLENENNHYTYKLAIKEE